MQYALVKNSVTENIIVWNGDLAYKAAMESQGYTLVPIAQAPPFEPELPQS